MAGHRTMTLRELYSHVKYNEIPIAKSFDEPLLLKSVEMGVQLPNIIVEEDPRGAWTIISGEELINDFEKCQNSGLSNRQLNLLDDVTIKINILPCELSVSDKNDWMKLYDKIRSPRKINF